MAFTNIIVIRYDAFGNIVFQSPNTLNAGSTGQGLLRVQVPFDNVTYTGSMTWSLANDQSVAQSFDTVTQITIEETVWYQWDKPIDDTITVVSGNNSTTDLLVSPAFTSAEQVLTMTQASIPITAGDVSQLSPIPVDDAADIRAKKRDRITDALGGIDSTKTNIITYHELESGGEKKESRADLLQATIDAVGGKSDFLGLPTNGLAGITSPLTGNPVTRTVSSIEDPDFDKDTPVAINHVIQSTGVWEIAFESVYEIGFAGASGSLSSVEFTQNLFAGKSGGDIEFRTRYFTYDAVNGLLPVTVPVEDTVPFHVGTVINITSDILAGYSKSNLALALDIDPSEMERIYTVSEVRGTAGDTAFAEIEDGVNTYSSWQLATSPAIENKIPKVIGATEDNLPSFTPDGGLKDSGIGSADTQLISNAGVTYPDLVAGKVPASQLPIELVEIKGTFGSGGSTTGGDVPASADLGNTYICDTNGFISTNASDTFFINDKALWTASGWIRNAANDSVRTVNNVASIDANVTLTKGNLGLGNVENTADIDKPISSAQAAVNATKLQYVGMLVDGVPVGANQFTKINVTSGGTLTQDGTDANQVNWDILGAGTGEGTIVLGQAQTIVPITVLTTNSDITFANQRQSTDLTVMELFDNGDAPANTFRVFKTATEIDNDPVQYKYFMQGKATNTNQAQAVTLSFRLFKDAIEVVTGDWPMTAVISEATAQVDGTNNFPLEGYVDTEVINDDEDYTLQISADATGVTLDALDIHFTSNFVAGEALSNLMRTDTYDTGKLGRVDKAKGDASGNDIELTYATKTEVLTGTITENFELLSGTWALVSGGDFDGLYEYDISDAGVTATDIAEVWAKQSTITLFNDAQFSPENDTTAGILTVYCTVLPTVSIFINYTITKGVV